MNPIELARCEQRTSHLIGRLRPVIDNFVMREDNNMVASTAYCVTVMLLSMALIALSYVGVCLKEKSWINWYTFPTLMTIAQNYILPIGYLLIFGPSGSHFAITYCYLTYACSGIAMMIGYTIGGSSSPFKFKKFDTYNYRLFPWILLATGALLYLPVLIEFRQFLATPRQIYAHTRTGYGLNFFGSSMMINLAFITYLFKKRKSLIGGLLFTSMCIALLYLHGSKGELLGMIEIFVLYRVYILRRSVRIGAASAYLAAFALAGSLTFALFGVGVANIGDLALNMTSYSDYTRNAMLVIDDPKGKFYGGRLTLEDEFYSRIPRKLMPDKPKDYGPFRLALIYFPGWFESDTGSPAFGLGVQYADFGIFAILFVCLWSALSGLATSLLVSSLRLRRDPGRFVLLLFFAEVTLIPLGAGYLLPETALLAFMLTFVYRHKLVLRLAPRHLTFPSTG